MHIPGPYQQFSKDFPELAEIYQKLGKTCREAGPLDAKCQDLVKLGIAIGANSRGAVMSHTRKSLASGASSEEIVHVALLSLTTGGFPNMIACLAWIKEVLDKEA